MTNMQKLDELSKIDFNLSVYIRRHKEVLLSVPGATNESVASLIINRLKNIINDGDQ